MNNEILSKNIADSFDDLCYPDLNKLENYLTDLNNVNLSKLVHWLSSNLNLVSSFESTVNEIDNEEEIDSFEIELSSLLKELGSPYSVDNLNQLTSKLSILNYLCGELLAASIDYVRRSKSDQEFDESEIAKQLRLIQTNLQINRPAADTTVKQIFENITECVDKEFKKRNIVIEDSVLFKGIKQIEPQMWLNLTEVNEMLKQEYEIRRRTLITRSDCTCASFKWKKEHQNDVLERKINEMYTKFNYLLQRDIAIDISDLMAIKPTDYNRLNNTVISKSHQFCDIMPPENSRPANQGIQQRLSLHKFIIGQVPDRGGRTEEAIKPEQETFAHQQNQREQQQQRSNRGNFHQNQGNFHRNQGDRKFNFNLDPNRVQSQGWSQYSGPSGANRNYQSQDEFNDGNYGNQQRRGGQRNNARGRGRGRY